MPGILLQSVSELSYPPLGGYSCAIVEGGMRYLDLHQTILYVRP
jgi:hypothetical protein